MLSILCGSQPSVCLWRNVYLGLPNEKRISGHRTGKGQFSFQSQRKVKVKLPQSCPILCNPTDHTIHGILQARILECVAFPFSRTSSQSGDQIQVSCIAGGFFTNWAIREVQSQRKIMSKNAQTTIPLHSFHMLAKYCSKFSKLGLNSMWTKGYEPWTSRCSSWI